MANLNKVMLIGNLTRDPQLSYLPSQTPVVEFGLAINRSWTGQDGQRRDETCFVDLRAYGRQAEVINQYMKKGSSMFVEGRLQFQQWTAQDGSKRSKHMVIVEGFQFLGRPGDSPNQGQGAAAGAASPRRGGQAPVPQSQQPKPPPLGEESQLPEAEADEDDVPF